MRRMRHTGSRSPVAVGLPIMPKGAVPVLKCSPIVVGVVFVVFSILIARPTVVQAHGACGSTSPSQKEKEHDLAALHRWKARYESKMHDPLKDHHHGHNHNHNHDDDDHHRHLHGNRMLEPENNDDNVGPHCVRCVTIDVWLHFLQDPRYPGGSASEEVVSDYTLQQQFDLTNSHFRDTPFQFRLLGINKVANERFASSDPDPRLDNNSLAREIGTTLRRGGADVMNVFFSDGVCKSNMGFARYPKDRGIWPDGTYHPDDTVFVCIELLHSGVSTTLTHEIGHWLGLYHTWENFGPFEGCDPRNLNDLVDDTPQVMGATTGCPTGRDSCPALDGVDLIDNFMDYTDDECQHSFTTGQKERMYQETDLYRRDLEPLGCDPASEATVSLDIMMDDEPTNKGFYIWDYLESAVVHEMGDSTLRDFANQRFQKTFCVLKHRPYDLTVVDMAIRGGLHPPGYYSLTVNDQEVMRGNNFPSHQIFHAFSADTTDCGASQQRFGLEIRYDCCSTDITWELRDNQDGRVIVNHDLLHDGGVFHVGAFNTLWVDRCLDLSTYTFLILDAKGNGLRGSAYFRLWLDGQEQIVGGGNDGFRSRQSVTMILASNSTRDETNDDETDHDDVGGAGAGENNNTTLGNDNNDNDSSTTNSTVLPGQNTTSIPSPAPTFPSALLLPDLPTTFVQTNTTTNENKDYANTSSSSIKSTVSVARAVIPLVFMTSAWTLLLLLV